MYFRVRSRRWDIEAISWFVGQVIDHRQQPMPGAIRPNRCPGCLHTDDAVKRCTLRGIPAMEVCLSDGGVLTELRSRYDHSNTNYREL
jgi:hypothetical protein